MAVIDDRLSIRKRPQPVAEAAVFLPELLIDLDTVNVQGDYRLYATEFINYLSVIIDSRVRKLLSSNPVASKYSFRQVFRFLSKLKRVCPADSGSWTPNASVKYVAELAKILCIGN